MKTLAKSFTTYEKEKKDIKVREYCHTCNSNAFNLMTEYWEKYPPVSSGMLSNAPTLSLNH